MESPEGWGMERDVKIASEHGFLARIVVGQVKTCPTDSCSQKERAIFPSILFHAGEKYAFPRNAPPERGTI